MDGTRAGLVECLTEDTELIGGMRDYVEKVLNSAAQNGLSSVDIVLTTD